DEIVHDESTADVHDDGIFYRETISPIGGNRFRVLLVDREHEAIRAQLVNFALAMPQEYTSQPVAMPLGMQVYLVQFENLRLLGRSMRGKAGQFLAHEH